MISLVQAMKNTQILLIFFPFFCFSQQIEFHAAFGENGSSSKTANILSLPLSDALNASIINLYNLRERAGIEAPENTIVISSIGLTALLPELLDGYELDPFVDLHPISLITETPDILVVRSDLNIKSIEELVQFSQRNATKLRYFYIAPTSIHRLEFNALIEGLGIEIELDRNFNNGNDDALEAIKNGDLDLMISTSPYMMPLIEEGYAYPVAIVHPQRISIMPNIPTFSELGIDYMNQGSWAAIFASKNTSDNQITELFRVITEIANDPEVEEQISSLGMQLRVSSSPLEFQSFLRHEMDRLKQATNVYNHSFD